MNEELLTTKQRLTDLKSDLRNSVREQTVTETKIKIHDRFGSAVFGTMQYLEEGQGARDIEDVIGIWESALGLLRGVDDRNGNRDAFKELDRAASMIGCNIVYTGVMPESRTGGRLVMNTITEALTNAVRHSRADELYVSMEKEGGIIRLEISNNGEIKPETVKEGDGLRALRRKLETRGGMLDYVTGEEFKTIALIPDV